MYTCTAWRLRQRRERKEHGRSEAMVVGGCGETYIGGPKRVGGDRIGAPQGKPDL